MASILCVDDEPAVTSLLEQLLTDMGHAPRTAPSVDAAIRLLQEVRVDLILLDCVLPVRDGFALLDYLRERNIKIPSIVMTGYSSIEHAVAAVQAGATDYLTKPLRAESVRLSVTGALGLDRLRRESEEARLDRRDRRPSSAVIGESEALREVLEAIEEAAMLDGPVLIHGEPGTGKQLFAREIHERSARRSHPFVSVKSTDLNAGQTGDARFGGARSTGRISAVGLSGALDRAAGGTLHLQEISLLGQPLQEEMARILGGERLEPEGAHHALPNVRVIATTTHDLGAAAEAGRFHRGLYARLAGVSIRTPPLRERPEDIPALTKHFAKRLSFDHGMSEPPIAPQTYAYLIARGWPGNVSELANSIERAMILHPGLVLTPELFGPGGEAYVPPPIEAAASLVPPTPEADPESRTSGAAGGSVLNLRDLQMIAIRQALQKTGGHKTRAAQLLGINERTLRNKLRGDGSRVKE